MEQSKSIAKIVGPTLMVMVFSEMKFWNPNLYDDQIAPVIYLNGTLLFIAGLSIIVKHNFWVLNWKVLITLLGYCAILLGLMRMLFPEVQKNEFSNNTPVMIFEIMLVLLGGFLTFKGYYSKENQ